MVDVVNMNGLKSITIKVNMQINIGYPIVVLL